MSLHYIIDGDNVVKGQKKVSLNDRIGLIHYLVRSKLWGSSKNKISVVFDGFCNDPNVRNVAKNTNVTVRFSFDQTADDIIKSLVKSETGNRLHDNVIIVVTNDRDLQHNVHTLGAKVMSITEFFIKGQNKNNSYATKATNPKIHDHNSLSFDIEQGITDEVAKLWLKK